MKIKKNMKGDYGLKINYIRKSKTSNSIFRKDLNEQIHNFIHLQENSANDYFNKIKKTKYYRIETFFQFDFFV